MKSVPAHFEKYIFVCENKRDEGKCCSSDGSEIRQLLKQRVKDLGLQRKIRISRSGCLDVCAEGPNVLVEPDHVWHQHVGTSDVGAIIDRTVKSLKASHSSIDLHAKK